MAVARKVDEIQIQLALQVGAGLGVSGDDQPGAVRRPVEAGDIPHALRQLSDLSTGGRHHEEVVIPAIGEALAVMFVIKTARDSGDRHPPYLLLAFGRPRVVHDSVRIRQDSADERNPASIRGPRRGRGAFGNRGQLPRLAPAGDVDDEELVRRAHPADEGEPASVRRPLGRVVAPRTARGLDRLGLEQTAKHHPASVLSRFGVGPGKLVRDALPVVAQPDVVDPSKTIKVFRANRPGHGVHRCYQLGNRVTGADVSTADPYRLAVVQLR